MSTARLSWNRLRMSPDATLYLIAAAQVAAALCIALLCKTNAITRLAAAWEGLDLIVRNGEIVGIRP